MESAVRICELLVDEQGTPHLAFPNVSALHVALETRVKTTCLHTRCALNQPQWGTTHCNLRRTDKKGPNIALLPSRATR